MDEGRVGNMETRHRQLSLLPDSDQWVSDELAQSMPLSESGSEESFPKSLRSGEEVTVTEPLPLLNLVAQLTKVAELPVSSDRLADRPDDRDDRDDRPHELHPLAFGTIVSSPGSHFTYLVLGPCCRLFDREELPWPCCRLQWRGKEPSWRRIGRRFVPDVAVKNFPSYAVEVLEPGYTGAPFVLTFYSARFSPELKEWWYSRRLSAQ
jgi:hypothetical protein